MQHTRDKEALHHLYNKILPQLAERIHAKIMEITGLFDDYNLEKILDTWAKDRNASSEKEISLENGNVPLLGLRLRLTGFQKAGVPPFDISKDLVFKTEYSTYEVRPDANSLWLEKPYLEAWTSQEMEDIAHRWSEEVIEEIMQKLQVFE